MRAETNFLNKREKGKILVHTWNLNAAKLFCYFLITMVLLRNYSLRFGEKNGRPGSLEWQWQKRFNLGRQKMKLNL